MFFGATLSCCGFKQWSRLRMSPIDPLLWTELCSPCPTFKFTRWSSKSQWDGIWSPGRLQSMGSLRVGHDWATSLSLFTFMHWRRKWQPTPVFLPGESQGWGSLVGWRLWGHTESDMTERLHSHFSLLCIGEGNGNPLHCSCLENPRVGGAW